MSVTLIYSLLPSRIHTSLSILFNTHILLLYTSLIHTYTTPTYTPFSPIYVIQVSDTKALRVPELEDLVEELQTINRSLEHRISTLCETPFINDAFTAQEMQMMYQELLAEVSI